MSDDAREVKSRVNIIEIVGDYVPLKRSGNAHWGLCPFHAEKTPSFSVSQERQSFHCFGCGKGGDAFTFLMEMEGLSFREALEQLAERAGVKLSPRRGAREGGGAPRSKDVRALLEEAAAYFERHLHGPGGEAARAYLSRRGLTPDDWRRFGLGWAPPAWDALLKHLASVGAKAEEAVAAGLATQGERGVYDRFRGRIMFPVRDEMAKIAGFGGRLIDGEGAKYVNSPEGELFAKRRLLYLLHEAKRAIRERGRAILTEGYMDAIRAHVSAFPESVASLGTALTEEQASLLKRFADLCYIVYDADGAGQEAALRGMYVLQRHAVEVRVVLLPEGQDPDDALAAEGGAEAFEGLLRRALPLPLYHLHVRKADLRLPGKRHRATEDLLDGFASLPQLDVQPYLPRIAAGFGVLEHEIAADIATRRKAREREREKKSVFYAEGEAVPSCVYIEGEDEGNPSVPMGREAQRALDLECAVCSLLWRNPQLCLPLSGTELLPCFADEAAIEIVSALLAGEAPDELDARWRSMQERACPERIARGDAVLGRENLDEEHFAGLLDALRTNAAQKRYEELKSRMASGEATEEDRAEYQKWAMRTKGRRGRG